MSKHTEQASITTYSIKDDGQFPNSEYPVLLYKNVLDIPFFRPAAYIEKLFKRNNWYNFWKSGIYEFNHYHSNTHEVMGVFKGKATILLGGTEGTRVTVEKGDVLIIPAGVAHQNLQSQKQIKCVGGYPNGIKYDMKYGKSDERPQADENIKKVSVSIKDPVYGKLKGIPEYWSQV